MTDLDTTDFDTTVKALVNAAVDRELAGHREVPPFDRAVLPDRSGGALSGAGLRQWRIPVLAASVAALLAVGSTVAIEHGRSRPARRAIPVGTVAGPSPSTSQSADPNQQEAARAFADAVAGAREASEVAGVSVGPISESDATRFADSGLWTMPGPAPEKPAPGRSYSVTVRYVVGYHTDKDGRSPSAGVSVVSGELRDVAGGSCPPPFLVRPGHTYLIDCRVVFRAGATGAVTFTDRGPTGTTGATFGLTDQNEPAASTSPSPAAEAAQAYAEALAAAAAAAAVVGVSDLPASAEELGRTGESYGALDGPIANPQPGKEYSLTLLYTPAGNGPAVTVLSLGFEDVAAGHCPGPLQVRVGHTYQFRCQVTFRAHTEGSVRYTTTGPDGTSTVGVVLNMP